MTPPGASPDSVILQDDKGAPAISKGGSPARNSDHVLVVIYRSG